MCLVFFYDFCMKLSRGKKNDGNCISVGTILMLDWFLFDWLSKMSFIGLKKNKVEYYFPYNRKLFISIDIWDCFHAYRLFFVLLLEKILSDKTCLHHFYLKLHFFIPVVRRYTKSNKFTICLQTLKKKLMTGWHLILNATDVSEPPFFNVSFLGMKNKDDFLPSSCRCLKEWKKNNAPTNTIGFL